MRIHMCKDQTRNPLRRKIVSDTFGYISHYYEIFCTRKIPVQKDNAKLFTMMRPDRKFMLHIIAHYMYLGTFLD